MKFKKPSQEVLERAETYQWVIKGKKYNISEMDRGQLMLALMDTCDVVEDLEDRLSTVMNEVFDKWRGGSDWDT